MRYITNYKSKNYYIGKEFRNNQGLVVKILGKAIPEVGKKYTSKYVVEFEDGQIGSYCSYRLNNGKFAYPIVFSNGNNQTNKYKTIYKRYEQMKNRCNNKNAKDYPRYGAKGIKFLFESLYEFWFVLQKDDRIHDLLSYPQDYQIDRIDNNGHYIAGNVRIATRSENQRNKNNSIYKLIDNKTNDCLYVGIKTDCEKYLRDNLNLKTSIHVDKKQIGRSKGTSIRCEKV